MTLVDGVILFLSLAQMGQAPPAAAPAPRSYNIYIRGALAGTERVEEVAAKDGSIATRSWHDILVTDGLETSRLAFETSLNLAKGTNSPIRYGFKYTSGSSRDSCDVSVRSGQLVRVLTRAGKTTESATPLEPSLILLDFNVYHHYDFLVRRYDAKRGGRQLFSDYIPLLGTTIGVAITPIEDSELDFGRGTIKVRNFRLEFVGVRTGVLSVDGDGRLVRLLIRDQDLEVLRSDVAPEVPPAQKEP
jgi:hypothetical protein